MTPEQKTSSIDLMHEIAASCNKYDPQIVLTTLQICLSEEIKHHNEDIGLLFDEMMIEFKKQASLLLAVSTLAKALDKRKVGSAVDQIVADLESAVAKNTAHCPTCEMTKEEAKTAPFTCHDPFHKTTQVQ